MSKQTSSYYNHMYQRYRQAYRDELRNFFLNSGVPYTDVIEKVDEIDNELELAALNNWKMEEKRLKELRKKQKDH